MKLRYIIQALMLTITVASNGYSMFAPTAEQTAHEEKAFAVVKNATDTVLGKARDVEKVALGAGPVDDINKATEAAHTAVQQALLGFNLPVDDHEAILDFWTTKFYTPIRENTDDKPEKTLFVQECLTELHRDTDLFHMTRLLIRLQVHGAHAYLADDPEDSEDGEGDVEGDDEDVVPNGAV